MYFVHIPKTGGTSITDSLQRHGYLIPFKSRHLQLCDVTDLKPDVPIITCIRNPYDRFYSMYTYFIKYQRRSDISFDEFVERYISTYHGSHIMNTQCSYITVDGTCPVTDFIRFEHLESDWRKVCIKYSMPYDLCHLRDCPIPKPTYNDDAKHLVDHVFADDIKLWKSLSQSKLCPSHP